MEKQHKTNKKYYFFYWGKKDISWKFWGKK